MKRFFACAFSVALSFYCVASSTAVDSYELLQQESHDLRVKSMWFDGLLVVLLLGAVYTIFKLREQNVRLKKESVSLARDSDERVKSSTNIASGCLRMLLEVIDQMHGFNVIVGRKIVTGQTKDLYKEVESGKYLQACSERIFNSFDSLMLEYDPAFIQRLNGLLLPDKRFSEPTDGRLTPELRIAALMQLGITNSAKLSQVLGLSLNTIYTYRNRLKNRALDRDNFENEIASKRFSL